MAEEAGVGDSEDEADGDGENDGTQPEISVLCIFICVKQNKSFLSVYMFPGATCL